MTNILLKIHYNKITEDYSCEKNDLLLEHFSNFAKKCKKNENDFIFLYKGSVVNYINPATGSKIKISDTIFGNSNSRKFNIFAVLISTSSSSEEEQKESLVEQSDFHSDMKSNLFSEEYGDTILPEIRRKINKQYYLDVVCPKCETTAIIEKVQDKNSLLLNVLNCGNFHYLKNIHYDALDEFVPDFDEEEKALKEAIDNKKAIRTPYFEKYKCDCCSSSKIMLTPPYDDVYICSCGSQYCSSCLAVHKDEFKDHKEYANIDDKNYICLEHGQKFVAYCLDCNANICEKCREGHKDAQIHEIIELNSIRVSKDVVNKYSDDVDKQKDILIDFTETLRCLFDEVLETIENYVNSYIMIERSLIRRYKSGFHNYQLLKNLKNKKLFEIDMINEMENLNKEFDNNKDRHNINNLFTTLLKKIYEPINKAKNFKEQSPKPSSGNKRNVTINYTLKNTSKKRSIKLFDPAFVKNNKDKLKMKVTKLPDKINIYDGDLIDYYRNSKNLEIEKMQIELTEKDGNNQVTDLSYMFNNCKYFESANFTNWNLNNITSMEAMFQLCKNVQLENISRIIKNNQNGNLVNIRALFCKCTNLKFVPDIDRWFFILNNETRLKNMSMLFSGCKGLGSINLNSWRNIKFNYLEDISYMFNRCTNLVMIDNIKRFNTTRVTNMCGLFNGCKKLTTLSNFKLITQSAEDMSIMFQGCENLERIDNDFYDAKNLKDISGMFSNCYKLNSIRNIIYYTSDKLENMTALFKNCKALTSPPEYIKHNNWVWSSVKGVKEMFAGCDRFTTAPRWFLNMKFYAGTKYDNLLKDCKINNKDKIKSDWKNNEISRSEIK